VVSDAIPLVTQTNGVIVVARLGTTKREALTHLRDQLINLDAPLLGVVVNSLGRDSTSYGGYGAGYGYYGTGSSVPTQEEIANGNGNGQAPPIDPTLEPAPLTNGKPVSSVVPEEELARAAGTEPHPPSGVDPGTTWEVRADQPNPGRRSGPLPNRLRRRSRDR
jgi:hypothetical protein